jgi:hypothetical protein
MSKMLLPKTIDAFAAAYGLLKLATHQARTGMELGWASGGDKPSVELAESLIEMLERALEHARLARDHAKRRE